MDWYLTNRESDKESQRKADERIAQEQSAAQEWEEAWNKSKADARTVLAERKRAYEASMKPPATADENLAAIRKLLEAQQQEPK